MKRVSLLLSAAFIGLSLTSSSAQGPKNNVLFIVDISGSMREPAGNEPKIAAAKKAFSQTMSRISATTNVGLMVFGNDVARNPRLPKGAVDRVACKDIKVLSHIGVQSAQALAAKIDSFQPKGETPIAASLLQAKDLFAAQQGAHNSVVLITDGREECGGNVCEVAKQLSTAGIDLKVHIVGLAQKPGDRETLECITKATGGEYVAANDGPSLIKALEKLPPVVIAQAPAPPPVKVQAPPPPPPPVQVDRCKSGSTFEICLLELSRRGQSVAVSLSVTNKADYSADLILDNVNATLTAPSGEQAKDGSHLRGLDLGSGSIGLGSIGFFAYAFQLQKPLDPASKFGLSLSYYSPKLQIAFLNVPSTGGAPKKVPVCNTGKAITVCLNDISRQVSTAVT